VARKYSRTPLLNCEPIGFRFQHRTPAAPRRNFELFTAFLSLRRLIYAVIRLNFAQSDSMRIDKYLWCIRAFKTRSQAAEQCKLSKVWLNDELVKASREVKKSDVLKVKKGPFYWSWKVVSFPTTRVGAKLVLEFVQEVTPAEEKHRMELFRLQQSLDRHRGLGRPTKKDRRNLDDFFSTFDFDDELPAKDQSANP
jgi:ribosome-associated heat shock protein Hsp15